MNKKYNIHDYYLFKPLEIEVVKKNDKAFIKATMEVNYCSEKYLRITSI